MRLKGGASLCFSILRFGAHPVVAVVAFLAGLSVARQLACVSPATLCMQ